MEPPETSGSERPNICEERATKDDRVEAVVDEKATSHVITSADLDGGARAWMQVLGAFIVFGNIWGFIFAFGSFQSYYELHLLPTSSPSDISWIGTVGTFLLVVIGVITGPLFDLGYFRAMLITGALAETLGIFLLSLAGDYYQIMLTQGVLLGLGNGLLYTPGLALVGRSFKKKRAIAMAITSCGAPAGGIVYTLAFAQLINPLGFAWTVRTMGFIMLGTYCISFPLLLWKVRNLDDLASGKARKLVDLKAFRDLPFWSYSMSNFFLFLGYLIPFVYIASYGQTALGLSQNTSLYISIVAQATSIVGRLVMGYLASRIGVMIPWTTCGLCSGVMTVAWIGVRSEASFIAYAALYGFFSGALIPLPPSVFPIVCSDPTVLGARLGMAQGIQSIASLIGSPIGGALVKMNVGGGRGYLGLQLFSGLVMIFGGVNLIGLWILLTKKRGNRKLV